MPSPRFPAALATVALIAAWSGLVPGSEGDSDGLRPQVAYDVAVVRDEALAGLPESPLWAPASEDPACLAATRPGPSSAYALSAWFPRHDLCASLPSLDRDAVLTDDIAVWVETNDAGWVSGVRVSGQDAIGERGVYHESDTIEPDSVELAVDGSFVIHVHADRVPLWRCDARASEPDSTCAELVGTFAIDDLVYTPEP